MLIQKYREYLENKVRKNGKKYAESSIKVYVSKINQFLDNGYSEKDLIGHIDVLIEEYSKGGSKYNEKDHNNTLNALKRLNDMLVNDYIDSFYIKCESSIQVWQKLNKTVMSYEIKNGKITITYRNNKKLSKKISDLDYLKLIKFIMKNEQFLSDNSYSSLQGENNLMDYSQPEHYEYKFGNKSGNDCEFLFESSNSNLDDQIRNDYKNLIDKIIQNL